jgi:hypothetical protein
MESARNHRDLAPPQERIDIISEADYQALNAHVFPTIHSLKWFIRKHRNRLTETGSGVVYDGVPLDGVEVRIDADGQRRARCALQPGRKECARYRTYL